MQNDYKKILLFFGIVCLLMIFTLYYTGSRYEKISNDYQNHFFNAKGLINTMESYPPVTKVLLQPFVFSLQGIYFYSALLCGLIIPFLLYKNAKHFSIVWLYFMAINLFWAMTGLGTLSQALIIVLILIYLLQHNWILKFLLVLSSYFIHSFGLFLMIPILIINLLFEKHFFTNFFGGCFAMIPKEARETMSKNIINSGVTIKDLTSFFVNGFPFPFLIISIIELWKNNKRFLCYGSLCFFSSFFLTNQGMRLLLISEVFFLFGLSSFYQRTTDFNKTAIIFFSFILLVYNLFTWFSGFIAMAGLC